jgi:hypothetical protein
VISHELAIEIWNRAAQAEIGIRVPTEDVNYLTSTLYAARKAEGNPEELMELSIVKVKGGIWLVKNSKK